MGSRNLSTGSDVNRFTLSRRRLLQQLRDDGSRNGEKDDFWKYLEGIMTKSVIDLL